MQGKQALAGAALQHVRSRPLVSRAAIPQQRALAPARFPTMPKRFMAVSGGEPAVIPVCARMLASRAQPCSGRDCRPTDTHARTHAHQHQQQQEQQQLWRTRILLVNGEDQSAQP